MLKRAAASEDERELLLALELIRRAAREFDPARRTAVAGRPGLGRGPRRVYGPRRFGRDRLKSR
jgi:hypothetical protein